LLQIKRKQEAYALLQWITSQRENTGLSFGPVAWRSGNAFHPINEVTQHRAGLVLEWVTACGQVNHLGM